MIRPGAPNSQGARRPMLPVRPTIPIVKSPLVIP